MGVSKEPVWELFSSSTTFDVEPLMSGFEWYRNAEGGIVCSHTVQRLQGFYFAYCTQIFSDLSLLRPTHQVISWMILTCRWLGLLSHLQKGWACDWPLSCSSIEQVFAPSNLVDNTSEFAFRHLNFTSAYKTRLDMVFSWKRSSGCRTCVKRKIKVWPPGNPTIPLSLTHLQVWWDNAQV